MHKLDDLDHMILTLLKANAKLGTKTIADKIGLSVTPTFERIRRLERLGIITGYHAKLSASKLGFGLKVICQISLKSHNIELIEQFEQAVKTLSEVSSFHHMAGNIDYLLFIEVADMDAYQDFLRTKLASIPNIANVQSSFVMKTLKD